MKIVSIIPARSGSKGVKNKNIREILDHPLIAYSIGVSKLCPLIEETYVSTDSPLIAEKAEKYGARVPFLRPKEYATDKSVDLEWANHFVEWYQYNVGDLPDLIVHLSPPTPLRYPEVIKGAINHIIKHPEATSLRSAHKVNDCPWKDFRMEDGYLRGLFDDMQGEYYNRPRQIYPQIYYTNGYVDILKPETILKRKMHGDNILGYEVDPAIDIDTEEDLDTAIAYAEALKMEHPVIRYLNSLSI